jgi:hypothetical protein
MLTCACLKTNEATVWNMPQLLHYAKKKVDSGKGVKNREENQDRKERVHAHVRRHG